MTKQIQKRDEFAREVRRAISDHFPWDHVNVTIAATTSGCPLIIADLGNGDVYNVVVTNKRKD